MTRLYLVRHGETLWNSEIRIQGHRDIQLSEVGRRQARALADRLRSVRLDAAYASDLERAAETAAIALCGHAVPVVVRRDLREASFGDWEGLTYQEITVRYPEQQRNRRERPAEATPPGGEPLHDLLDRVRRAIDDMVVIHAGQSVLVVTHGGPIRVLIGHVLGLGVESYWKLRIDNCSLSIVDTYPEGAIISLLNDTCHLIDLDQAGDV